MKLPKELTTVTPLSKYFAMILFISLPFVGFLLGIKYQETINLQTNQSEDIISINKRPTPTSKNINEWEIYTNKKYGFSFNYPSSWKTQSIKVYNPKYFGEGDLFLDCSTSVFSTEIFDMIKHPSSYTDLESYLKIRGINATLSTGKIIVLGGKQAMYWQFEGDPGSSNPSSRAVLFSKSGKFIIDLHIFNYCGKNLQQTSNIFNQILSTFRFAK